MNRISIIILLCFLGITVYSQEKRFALVIGNSDYQFGGSLDNPVNDARSMEVALKGIGFEVMKYENLGRQALAMAIDNFGNRLSGYDIGLFFYAGHGVQSKGFNYLIPVDASLNTESDVEFNCIRADRVLGKMEDARNNVNIIILDACRDNPFERGWTRTTRGRGLATMSAPVGSVIGFATSPGSTASDGSGKNGLYTSGLLSCLNEPGITAIQMFQKVTAYVQDKSNGKQLPWLASSLTGDVFLIQGSGKTDNTKYFGDRDNYTPVPETVVKERSIAVLPFKNLTGKEDQEYLVAGQNETLINELSRISQYKPLRVIYRGSVNSFRNYEKPMFEIAKEIDVDVVVEGSVMGIGDSLMIQMRLVQVLPEEKILWVGSYTSDIPNILDLYNGIADQIAQKLDLDLSEDEKKAHPVTRKVNPESYKAYLRGMYNLSRLTPSSVQKGFDYLHEAVRIDPAEPLAYAGLALGYAEIAHSPQDPGDALPKAEAAALRALRIDSTLAETWSALGEVKLYYAWDFEKANEYLARALEINPNLGVTHFHISWAEYLYGNMDKAIDHHILSRKYDPFHPSCTSWLAGLYCYDGQYEKAIEMAHEGIKIQEDHPVAYYVLGATYGFMGNEEEAIAAHKKLAEIDPGWSFALGYTYAKFDHREEAEKILSEYENLEESPWNAYGLLVLNAALGNLDEAFKWLNYEPHHAYTGWVAVMPEFDNMRDDPRFEEFVKRLKIPK